MENHHFIAKSTINIYQWAIFNSYVSHYQRVMIFFSTSELAKISAHRLGTVSSEIATRGFSWGFYKFPMSMTLWWDCVGGFHKITRNHDWMSQDNHWDLSLSIIFGNHWDTLDIMTWFKLVQSMDVLSCHQSWSKAALPSGNLTVCYWTWWFIVDLPLKMVIFHSYVNVHRMV